MFGPVLSCGMEPVSSTILLAVSKAVVTQAGKELGGGLGKGVKRQVLGDPQEKAFAAALGRAYTTTQASHGYALTRYDVNPGFLELEAATELAKVVIPGAEATPYRLAECCIDSLAPGLFGEKRWTYLLELQPVFAALVTNLQAEIRRERALDNLTRRSEEASTGDAATRIAERLGAATATDTDVTTYLRWVIDHHLYLRTTGMVHNTNVQLPLRDVFVGLSSRRDRRPGDRAHAWLKQRQSELDAMLTSGDLDPTSYEAKLDRMHLQAGTHRDLVTGQPDSEPRPVMDAVKNTSHLLVLGDPGSGKTTLLKFLALRNAETLIGFTSNPIANARLPIYVRIGEFARSAQRSQGLSAFLPGYFARQECNTPGLPDLIQRKLDAGEGLLLLDGLDEIGSADDRRAVVDAVTSLTTAYQRQGNRFVITSRIAGYLAAPLPEPFQAERLLDMSDTTITQFLDSYCTALERADAPDKSAAAVLRDARTNARDIRVALKNNAGVRRLAANPLLLTALVLVHKARGRLPHRRIEAYVEVSEALGRTWRSVQGVPEAELPDELVLNIWLTRIGSWLHAHRPEGSATKNEFLEVLGPLWAKHTGLPWDPDIVHRSNPLDTRPGADVEDFLRKTEISTGLLVERAPGRYGFPHLTFEEYYAGRALAFEGRAVDRPGRIRARLHDPRYQEPILLALGLVGRQQADEIELLIADAIYPATTVRHDHEDLLGWDFLFALRTLADDIPLDTTIIDTLLTNAVHEYLNTDSRCRFTRYRTALQERLRDLGGTRAARRLALVIAATVVPAGLEDRFCSLVEVWPVPGDPPSSVFSSIAEIARTAADPDVRFRAVEVLAGGGSLSAEAASVATDLARTAPDLAVRVHAVSTLARGGSLSAEAATIAGEIARTAAEPAVRIRAVGVLAAAGSLSAEATSVATDLARTAPDLAVRVRAVGVLAAGALFSAEVATVATDLARTAPDLAVRVQAVGVFAGSGSLSAEMAAAATDLACTAPDLAVRVQTVGMLADGGLLSAEAAAIATDLARTAPDQAVRVRAVGVLAAAGALSPEVTAIATDLARTAADPNLRIQALRLLADRGSLSTEAAAIAGDLARTAVDPAVRIRAVRVLVGGSLSTEAVAIAGDLARTAVDPAVRVQALTVALDGGGFLSMEAVAIAEDLARTAIDPAVRVQAVRALVGNGSLSVEAAATAGDLARTAPDPNVRIEAVGVLASGWSLSVAAAIATDLARNASDPAVRVRAVRVLGEGGSWSAEVAAIAGDLARNAPHPNLQIQALRALAGCGPLSAEAMAVTTDLAHTTADDGVRLQALTTLAGDGPPPVCFTAALTDIAQHSEAYSVRRGAMTMLGRLDLTPVVDASLKSGLLDEDNEVRREAGNAFAEIANRQREGRFSLYCKGTGGTLL